MNARLSRLVCAVGALIAVCCVSACARLLTVDPIDYQVKVVQERFQVGMTQERTIAAIDGLHMGRRSCRRDPDLDACTPEGVGLCRHIWVVDDPGFKVIWASQGSIDFWFDDAGLLEEVWLREHLGGEWRSRNEAVLRDLSDAGVDTRRTTLLAKHPSDRRGTLRLLPLAPEVREVLDRRSQGAAN